MVPDQAGAVCRLFKNNNNKILFMQHFSIRSKCFTLGKGGKNIPEIMDTEGKNIRGKKDTQADIIIPHTQYT